jgi:hypothetical protein
MDARRASNSFRHPPSANRSVSATCAAWLIAVVLLASVRSDLAWRLNPLLMVGAALASYAAHAL